MTYNITSYTEFLPKKSLVFQRVSDAIIMPKFIKLAENLYCIAFSAMKLLPAKHIICEAIKRGEINNNCTIVDTSSGTFALGLGIVCAELGLPFRIFGDPAISNDLRQRLNDLGGKVHITTNPASPGAYQKLRLEALENYLSKEKLAYWARQYDNLDNANSYAIIGERILDTLGSNITLVGSVGSGGSTCGMMKVIRMVNPGARLVGVDTFNSVLFGQPDGRRVLRGLGNTILPKNLKHELFDEVHWVSANDAFTHTRNLFRHHSFFCGPTTGAAYQVARYLSSKNPNITHVFISPDDGARYLSTVYNDAWLMNQDFFSSDLCSEPKEVSHPRDAIEPWAYYKWDRKSYYAIIGDRFV